MLYAAEKRRSASACAVTAIAVMKFSLDTLPPQIDAHLGHNYWFELEAIRKTWGDTTLVKGRAERLVADLQMSECRAL